MTIMTKERRFHQLLQSLPEEYSVIVDVFDTQGVIDVDRGLQRLEEKEASLRIAETGMYAKRHTDKSRPSHSRSRPHSSGSRRELRGRDSKVTLRMKPSSSSLFRRKSLSDSSSDGSKRRVRFSSKGRKAKCYICNETNHMAIDCDLKKEIVKMRKARNKEKDKKKSKSKASKHRAYNAEDDSTSEESSD